MLPTPLRTQHAPTCNLQIVGELHALQRRCSGRPQSFRLQLEGDFDVVITKLNNMHCQDVTLPQAAQHGPDSGRVARLGPEAPSRLQMAALWAPKQSCGRLDSPAFPSQAARTLT